LVKKEKRSFNARGLYNAIVLVLLIVTAGYVISSFHLSGGLSNITGQTTVEQQAYQQGVNDAQTLVTQEIIKQLNEQGFVEVRVPTSDGQLSAIRLGILQEQ
jgi:hypothetical protein|tara:strand:- start:34955 stop:35260 length:306 start_codon:yes stop_codon:yes gene_type:complete